MSLCNKVPLISPPCLIWALMQCRPDSLDAWHLKVYCCCSNYVSGRFLLLCLILLLLCNLKENLLFFHFYEVVIPSLDGTTTGILDYITRAWCNQKAFPACAKAKQGVTWNVAKTRPTPCCPATTAGRTHHPAACFPSIPQSIEILLIWRL